MQPQAMANPSSAQAQSAAVAGPRHPADIFSEIAYRCVSDGIVRLEDRRQLARAAAHLGLRPFEAQLLIACAIRQKTIDEGPRKWRRHFAENRPRADVGRSRRTRFWKSLTLLAATAAALDTLLIYLWLS
jgi:hypothetical protein